jgi:hypothetical protein
VKKIIYTISSTDVPSGYYRLSAHISALWGDAAKSGSYAKCYFQDDSDYTSGSTAQRWGSGMLERGDWNSFNMNVMGDWFPSSSSKVHLVCATSGTIKGISVMVYATSATNSGPFVSSGL